MCVNKSCGCNTDSVEVINKSGVTDVCVCGVLYKVSTYEENGCLRVYASPCTLPSCVFEVATICKKQNTCMQFDFYEASVFTDPVEIIIDCNLCQIIKRAIEIYLKEVNDTNFTNCKTSFFGF